MIEQTVIVKPKDDLLPALSRAIADYLEMPLRVNEDHEVDVSFTVKLTDKAVFYKNLVATCDRGKEEISITLRDKKTLKLDVKCL